MLDDPLSIVVAGVWLMAAGMYPVGFLFGVCSDCCPQCPEECSKCTHYANLGFTCDSAYDIVDSLTYAVTGYGSVTINDPYTEPSIGCGDNSIDFPVEDLPAGANDYIGTPCILSSSLGSIEVTDECGCNTCLIEVGLTAGVSMENDGSLVMGRAFYGNLQECTDTTLQLTASSGFQITNEDNVPDAAAVVAWFDALNVTVSITIPECDCGACCDNGCEENVAEGGCATWQGVGVDCDPDPCV